MGSFELIKSYSSITNTDTIDSISVAPYWLLMFVGLQTPLSFSRQKRTSVTQNATQGSRSKIIVTDDCVSMSINNSKESHTKNLQLNLIQGNYNYLTDILPGDWVVAWTFNDKTTFESVLKKIQKNDQSNGFYEGLKFIGRVNSIRKNMTLSDDGTKHTFYNVDAFGFRELDSEFFYDTALAENLLQSGTNLSWLARINLNIKDLFQTKANGEAESNARSIITNLIKILVGSGVKSSQVNPLSNQNIEASPTITTEEAPYAYIVPSEISQILGKRQADASKNSNIVSYCDILEIYSGIQSFDTYKDSTDYKVFAPDIETTDGIERFTGVENLGSYAPTFVGFANKPLWSLLQQYQNPVINELFTCLRVNPDGDIVPQIIFRQIPFTTPVFASINGKRVSAPKDPDGNVKTKVSYDVPTKEQQQEQDSTNLGNSFTPKLDITPFHSLPRWRLHPAMIKSMSLGRSDALRTNYVHIYGQNALYAAGSPSIVQQIVQNPPISNTLDIQLNGFRSFMTTVASGFNDEVGKSPTAWIELSADFMMGAHLTLNGTIETVGIHLPICEGDNLELDDMIFHIESVTHQCSIDRNGSKHFLTSLTVTNGVKNSDFSSDNGDTDVQNTFYLGFDSNDARKYDPGLTVDSEFAQTKTNKNTD